MKQERIKQIHNLQQQIAAMEQEIEHLYGERKNLVQESESLLRDLLNMGENVLPGADYHSELDKILDARAEMPKKACVACQGVEGSYSHQAADQFFAEPDIHFYGQFEDVFRAVENEKVEYGILPIENSTAGSVAQVYDLMRKHNFYIIKDTKVLVRHNLLTAGESDLAQLTDVYSHSQALSQCSELQAANPYIRFHEYSNTAAAAKFVAEQNNPCLGAIASSKCAQLYQMHILQEDVQDITGNATRFICISKTPGFSADANKISLCLAVPHKPRALYHLLHKFAMNNLNLCKLESRPYPEKKFEYLFYLDVEGRCDNVQVRWLLNDLNNQLGYFKFLGSYNEQTAMF